MKTAVLIVAGGGGTRMGGGVPKQFMPLKGKPVLVRTVERFRKALPHAEIFIALPSALHSEWSAMAAVYGLGAVCKVCTGGDTRFATVRNSLEEIGACDVVLVHDAVRPLVPAEVILRVEACAAGTGACIPVTVPVDSFRTVLPDGSSVPTDRSTLRAVQTPQGFGYAILKEAYDQLYKESFTDDASVVEAAGYPVSLCEGSPVNIKITYPQDIAVAEALMDLEK